MADRIADVAVIGAGIAGAGIAAELARDASVLVIEREDQPGYHTTGRSAAVFSATYGPAPIRALSRASEPFYASPPEGFAEAPLLSPRGALLMAREDQMAALEALAGELSDSAVARLDAAEMRAMNPLLREGYAAAGIYEPDAQDIDVAAVHQGYLRALRARGGEVLTRAEVASLRREGTGWRIETSAGTVRAGIVVNASGAWADEIGRMAGAMEIGLVPKRRTALIVAAPEGMDPGPFPATIDCEEQFYLKPDAGRLLISPADETPSAPCDAQPEELDVAICVDRVERAFDLSIRRIENRWAGLRSFVADKAPVCGFDPTLEGFFWLAGQGGYGIQSAPGLSRLAASLVLGRGVPEDIAAQGLRQTDISPERLS